MTTCAMISLGCPKNLVDGEQILGLLKQAGLDILLDPDAADEADIVIVNTCGFLSASREESLANIHALEAMRTNPELPLKTLIVTGCLVSRDRERLAEACPAVDAFLDVFSREQIVNIVRQALGQHETQNKSCVIPENRLYLGKSGSATPDTHRFALLPSHVAYLKIAEGCDRRCTFCTIPGIRGPYVSKTPENVLAEAKNLAKNGVKELIIIAQDTTCYGRDLPSADDSRGKATLATLLTSLAEIPEIQWIRVMYLYPQNFGDDLIHVFATVPKILPYIDIPLQHINDRILASMRRAATRQTTLSLLEKLYDRIPRLAVRTAFIVGYPGETQAEFDELLAFIQKRKFQRLGVFTYSAEEGTTAAEMPKQVHPKIAAKRADAVMKAQQKISAQWLRGLRGKNIDIILDVCTDRDEQTGEETWIGRSVYDAPEIDGCVYVTGRGLRAGDIVACQIVGSDEYDLDAVPADACLR